MMKGLVIWAAIWATIGFFAGFIFSSIYATEAAGAGIDRSLAWGLLCALFVAPMGIGLYALLSKGLSKI